MYIFQLFAIFYLAGMKWELGEYSCMMAGSHWKWKHASDHSIVRIPLTAGSLSGAFFDLLRYFVYQSEMLGSCNFAYESISSKNLCVADNKKKTYHSMFIVLFYSIQYIIGQCDVFLNSFLRKQIDVCHAQPVQYFLGNISM